MTAPEDFDFWYAVNNTEVLQVPSRQLEAFGQTHITYYLLSEMMDSVDKVRIREGTIDAARPQIITPGQIGNLPLDGFENGEAQRYAEWLQSNAKHLHILQYGFQIKKREVKDSIVSEPLPQVIDNVRNHVSERNNPYSAILQGVDQPWEVCLMKLMVDMVEMSAPGHAQQFQQANLLPSGPNDIRRQIDEAFLAASRDASLISDLQKMLETMGVFAEHEDRFFALVRSSKS